MLGHRKQWESRDGFANADKQTAWLRPNDSGKGKGGACRAWLERRAEGGGSHSRLLELVIMVLVLKEEVWTGDDRRFWWGLQRAKNSKARNAMPTCCNTLHLDSIQQLSGQLFLLQVLSAPPSCACAQLVVRQL